MPIQVMPTPYDHPNSLCFESPRLDTYVSFKPSSELKLAHTSCLGLAPSLPLVSLVEFLGLVVVVQVELPLADVDLRVRLAGAVICVLITGGKGPAVS